MKHGLSLDERYLEFAKSTAAVFAQHPQLEPLRHFVFKELLTQRKAAGWKEVGKHWARPLLYRSRTTSSLKHQDAFLWIEGAREVIVDALLPVYRELDARDIHGQLVSFGYATGLPDSTVHLQFPFRLGAPGWAKPAWNDLCDVVKELRNKHLTRAFFRMTTYVQGLFDELGRILDLVRPKIVLTASTQMIGGGALVIASRERGIRTVVLQHGILHALYTPVLADYVLTWGQSSLDVLVRFGVSPQTVKCVGSPRHDAMLQSTGGGANTALLSGLSLPERPTFVFFSNGNDLVRNGFAPIECAKWLDRTADEYAHHVNFVVRLHPNEDDSLYRNYSHLCVTKGSLDLALTLHGCDWVGSLCSTVLYDALLFKKPVWQFYADGWPELANNWREGLALRISSQEELSERIGNALFRGSDRCIDDSLCDRVFANRGRAAQAIADFVQERL